MATLTSNFHRPGSAGNGTNPEQLFAAGWSACFEGAMAAVARKMKIALPADMAVDAELDLSRDDDAYFLQARLNVGLPGLERDLAQTLTDAAHQTCPYSKAARGSTTSRESGKPLASPIWSEIAEKLGADG
jgi:lipoyl-dependent peroxiredoxin